MLNLLRWTDAVVQPGLLCSIVKLVKYWHQCKILTGWHWHCKILAGWHWHCKILAGFHWHCKILEDCQLAL